MLLAACLASAEQRPFEVSAPLRDGETPAALRDALLREVRLRAGAEARAYVRGRSTLRGERLDESVESAAGGAVEVIDLAEAWEVMEGRPVLVLRGWTEVDIGWLRSQIEEEARRAALEEVIAEQREVVEAAIDMAKGPASEQGIEVPKVPATVRVVGLATAEARAQRGYLTGADGKADVLRHWNLDVFGALDGLEIDVRVLDAERQMDGSVSTRLQIRWQVPMRVRDAFCAGLVCESAGTTLRAGPASDSAGENAYAGLAAEAIAHRNLLVVIERGEEQARFWLLKGYLDPAWRRPSLELRMAHSAELITASRAGKAPLKVWVEQTTEEPRRAEEGAWLASRGGTGR